MANSENRQDGIKQIAAGITMVIQSSLLEWDETKRSFKVVMSEDFEYSAKKLHPKFGRVMKWVLFSAGAEYLPKGALLINGQLSPKPARKFDTEKRPDELVDKWLAEILCNSAKKESVKDYGTLESATRRHLKDLCSVHNNGPECTRLRAAYVLLANAIRNRDTHAYIEDVRLSNFHLTVIFCDAFNNLLKWTDNDALAEISVKIKSGHQGC